MGQFIGLEEANFLSTLVWPPGSQAAEMYVLAKEKLDRVAPQQVKDPSDANSTTDTDTPLLIDKGDTMSTPNFTLSQILSQ